MESRQGYTDPSKAEATVGRPEERADLGHKMQGTLGAEAGNWSRETVYLGILCTLYCSVISSYPI